MSSSFKARNLFYLRISANNVLPFYLYLDERHKGWMSDQILQHVLLDLRPLIIPKLRIEADAHIGPGGPANAKGTVEVHRGDTYQFAFFFRKTEPHSILIKTRNYIALPPQPVTPPLFSTDDTGKLGKRTRKQNSMESRERKKVKTKRKGKDVAKDDDDNFTESEEDRDSDIEVTFQRRSLRQRNKIVENIVPEDRLSGDEDEDIQMQDSGDAQKTGTSEHPIVKDEEEEPVLPQIAEQQTTINVESEYEERKPKPGLQLRYNGFKIFGRCLCVVVEPWPPVRKSTVPPMFNLPPPTVASRASSVVPSLDTREQTPLFLPDIDERGRSMTPAVSALQQSWKPPVPLFDDPPHDGHDHDDGELLLFSQVLNAAGELRMEVDDEDEFDGAVLFGDADETKELQ